MFTAIDAPTPASPLPAAAALADTVLSVRLTASTVTSPADRVTLAPLLTRAVVLAVATLMATEPATPTSPPLAPDRAVAPKRWVSGASPATSFMVARSVRPSAVMVLPVPIKASFVMSATLMATATPTAVPPLLVLALPSALVVASMLLDACSDSVPVPALLSASAVMVRLGATMACAVDSATFNAMAAATLTSPLLLLALVRSVPCSLVRPDLSSARSVCLPTCLLASSLVSLPSPSSSFSAPAADASASAVLLPSAWAPKAMLPSATKLRCVPA